MSPPVVDVSAFLVAVPLMVAAHTPTVAVLPPMVDVFNRVFVSPLYNVSPMVVVSPSLFGVSPLVVVFPMAVVSYGHCVSFYRCCGTYDCCISF